MTVGATGRCRLTGQRQGKRRIDLLIDPLGRRVTIAREAMAAPEASKSVDPIDEVQVANRYLPTSRAAGEAQGVMRSQSRVAPP